jgi:cytidylate kinase
MKPILTPKIDQNIAFQVKRVAHNLKKSSTVRHPSITISREFGCEGFPLANVLASKLSVDDEEWSIFSSDMLREISDKNEYERELTESLHESYRSQLHQDLDVLLSKKPSDYSRFRQIAQNLKIIGAKGRTILVGSGGAILTQNEKNFFHVRLTASPDFRINRICELLNISRTEASNLVEERDLYRRDLINRFTNKDVSDPSFYHLILRNDYFSANEIADIIIHALRIKELLK